MRPHKFERHSKVFPTFTPWFTKNCAFENLLRIMNWLLLILAGLMEVGFTFCLGKTKTATGHELTWWGLGFLGALALSMYLMTKAAEKIPIGTVYPVWTGIGAVGAVAVGILFFNEPATFWRIFFLTTLILSIVGLKILG